MMKTGKVRNWHQVAASDQLKTMANDEMNSMSSGTAPLVLTIDDELSVRQSYCRYLEDHEYRVLQAENGRIGLEIFDREHPDIVLVDLRMPEIDGLDVLASVRDIAPDTPVIVISGTGVIGDVVEALRRGAWDFLVKPLEDLTVLRHAVEKCLERARLIRENRIYQTHLEDEVRKRTKELEQVNLALRQSEEKFRNIVESSPMGMHMYHLDEESQKLVFSGANPSADWILGVDNSQFVGKDILEAFPQLRDTEVPEKYRLVASRGEMWQSERIDYEADQIKGAFEVCAFQTSPGNMVTTFLDVTDRVRANEEREQLIAGLEDKNAELERFAYTVSHDLKTPLITIRGFVDLLNGEVSAGNVEDAQSHLSRISHAADKMRRLLEEVLDLSRIGRVVNEWTEVPFVDLIRDVQERIHELSGRSQTTLTVAQNLPVVRGDRTRLIEAIQSVLENAVKYMGDQEQPAIEVGFKAVTGEITFFVSDNGIGIAPRYHEKIFGLFDQLDARSDGTGVGLAVAKRIVEVHGGRMWVESEGEGCGSTFYFTLPLAKEVAECQVVS